MPLMWTRDIEYAVRAQWISLSIAMLAFCAYCGAQAFPMYFAGREAPPVAVAIGVYVLLGTGRNVHSFDGSGLEPGVGCKVFCLSLISWAVLVPSILLWATPRPLMFSWSCFTLLVAAMRLRSGVLRRHSFGAGSRRDRELGGFFGDVADVFAGMNALVGISSLAMIYLEQEAAWVFTVTVGSAVGSVLAICIGINLPDRSRR